MNMFYIFIVITFGVLAFVLIYLLNLTMDIYEYVIDLRKQLGSINNKVSYLVEKNND